ncbi:arginine--tRNA ligase, partial [Candidatus Falkowbacteria bacterium]|nr:arginine--tRNA ligase [Candidatus Falkowbacteria bacterium]
MKQLIQSHLKKIINKKYPHFHGEIALEYPPDAKMGDLAFPCFELAKIAKKSPNAVALELAPEHAPEQIKHIKEAKAQGPYLNLFLNKELFWKELFSKNDSHASRDSNASCIMIEFSSPNTNKPLHLGHVRNNCLGSSLSNLLESRGNKITRASLVNDRGVHICKSIFAYQQVENGKWKMPC